MTKKAILIKHLRYIRCWFDKDSVIANTEEEEKLRNDRLAHHAPNKLYLQCPSINTSCSQQSLSQISTNEKRLKLCVEYLNHVKGNLCY